MKIVIPNELDFPDSIEPVIGMKWLRIDKQGKLYSKHYNTPWPVGGPLQAQCHIDRGYSYQPRRSWETNPGPTKKEWRQEQDATSVVMSPRPRFPKKPKLQLPWPYAWSWEPVLPDHEAPGEGCTCGIYLVYRKGACVHYSNSFHPQVLVEVALWGRTVVATEGARGELAYPQKILDSNGKASKEMLTRARELYGLEATSLTPEPTPAPGKALSPGELQAFTKQFQAATSSKKPNKWNFFGNS